MQYVITNGCGSYLRRYSNNEIKGTNSKKTIQTFPSESEAQEVYEMIPQKYKKTFYVSDYASANKKPSKSKTKRCAIDPIIRQYIYRQADGKCALCGRPLVYTEMTIDHIIPLSKGGENEIENFQCTCKECNEFKQSILPEDFMDRIVTIFKHNFKNIRKKGIRQRIIMCMLKMIS